MFKDGKLSFKEESSELSPLKKERLWNILIVDDDEGVHDVSKLALSGFEFEKKRCRFISAYSAGEAKKILETDPSIALAIIDVVMETEDAGLDLVNHIRNTLKNKLIRIILRTGQPGQAPEEKVIHDYDINDYKSKNELTTQKLYTSVLTGLRSYRDMLCLEKNRQGLKKVIEAAASIEKVSSLEIFLSAVLEQIIALLHLTDYGDNSKIDSFIAALEGDNCLHITGSGTYESIKKENFCQQTSEEIRPLIEEAIATGKEICRQGHYILYRPSSLHYSGFVLYMESEDSLAEMDKDMLRLFFEQSTAAFENAAMVSELDESQKETIFTISEIIENRSSEIGRHAKRVALYSKILARAYGLSAKEVETVYTASSLHDIGEISITDEILQKPGQLTDEEMAIVRTHAQIGYEMLRSSKGEILKTSSIISKEHHEKYDGSGYPQGLKGENISIFARIVALSDVFDALGSVRVYKERWEMHKILAFIKQERGKHFDPKIVDIFFENIDEILEVHALYQD